MCRLSCISATRGMQLTIATCHQHTAPQCCCAAPSVSCCFMQHSSGDFWADPSLCVGVCGSKPSVCNTAGTPLELRAGKEGARPPFRAPGTLCACLAAVYDGRQLAAAVHVVRPAAWYQLLVPPQRGWRCKKMAVQSAPQQQLRSTASPLGTIPSQLCLCKQCTPRLLQPHPAGHLRSVALIASSNFEAPEKIPVPTPIQQFWHP